MRPSTRRCAAGLIALTLLAAARADAAPGQKGSASIGAASGVLFAAGEWDYRVYHLGLSATYAVVDRLSLVIVPSLAFFEWGTLVAVPVGLQLDVALGLVPGLSLYARATGGAAFAVAPEGGTVGLVMFDAGLKYNVLDWLYVGVEPLSLPIFLNGDPPLVHKPAVVAGFSF